jgi:cystathionine beta-lyase family protein involved in aluminum resistance
MQQNEKEAFDQQTIQVNEHRTMLEEEKAKRLRDMEIAYKQANLQQMDEKINKEALLKELDTQERLGQIDYLTNHDFYTENTVLIKSFRELASLVSAETEFYLITGKA